MWAARYFGFLDTDMVRAAESDEILAQEEFANSRAAFGRPAPVSKGVERIVRGIEGRSRRVYYPPWIIAPLLAPAPFQRLIELGMARRGVFEMIRKLDEQAAAAAAAQSPVCNASTASASRSGGDRGAQLGHQAGRRRSRLCSVTSRWPSSSRGLEQVAQVARE